MASLFQGRLADTDNVVFKGISLFFREREWGKRKAVLSLIKESAVFVCCKSTGQMAGPENAMIRAPYHGVTVEPRQK